MISLIADKAYELATHESRVPLSPLSVTNPRTPDAGIEEVEALEASMTIK